MSRQLTHTMRAVFHFVKERSAFASFFEHIIPFFSQSGMVGLLRVRSGGRRFVLFFKLRMVLEM